MMAELHKPTRVTLHCDVVVYDCMHLMEKQRGWNYLKIVLFWFVIIHKRIPSFPSLFIASFFYFPHFSLIGKLILPKLTPVFKLQRFISAQPFLIEGILQVRSWTQPVFS